MRDDSFWLRMRRELLPAHESTNLNAGTLSPTPLPVFAAADALRRAQAAAPSDFLWRQSGPLIALAREKLAKFVNARPANVLLLTNVTFAINLAAGSIQAGPGSEILLTDHEYGAMEYCWERLARERGWTIRIVTLPYKSEDPQALVNAVEAAMAPATKVLFFSHVASTTGLVLPAAQLCAVARRRGVLSVVDGAHAAGMVALDMEKIGADFYGANCHKWMMAPLGAGFLHVREEHKPALRPQVTSWGWKYDPAEREMDSGLGGTKWQHAFEFYGCDDRCPQMVIPQALEVRDVLGGEAEIAARVRGLAQYLRGRMAELGYAAATPQNPDLSSALTAFEFPSLDPIKWRDWVWERQRIECPVTVSKGRCFLRVSTPWFATFEELDRLAAALKEFPESLGALQ